MTSSGGEWIAVPIPGQPDRWDWVPGEQPPSPDGSPGAWHVVGGSGEGAGKWAWFPASGAAPSPAAPAEPEVVMPWEKAAEPVQEPVREPVQEAAPKPGLEQVLKSREEPVKKPAKMPWDAAAEAAAAAAELLGGRGTRGTRGATPSPTPAPASAAGKQGPNPWQPVQPGTPVPPPPVTQQPIGQQPIGQQPAHGQQPGFGQPAAGGWQAAPPVATPEQGGGKKVPLIILAVVVVLAVIGSVVAIALSGGDDGKNKDAIIAVANDVATVEDHKTVCSSHLTEDMVRTVFGTLETCEKNDAKDDTKPPTSANVEAIKIDGKSATAKVTLVGGDLDGTTGTWSFAKQENAKQGDRLWRVSEWQVDYLRSWFGKQLDQGYKPRGDDDPFADANVRSCVSQKFRDLDDNGFRDTAYALLKESDEGARKMFDFMSACPSDTEGVSALRAYFEKEFRASAQLSPSLADCAVLAMRTALTEDDLKTLFVEQNQEHPEIQAKLQAVGAGCASGTTINPTPAFEDPNVGGLGT